MDGVDVEYYSGLIFECYCCDEDEKEKVERIESILNEHASHAEEIINFHLEGDSDPLLSSCRSGYLDIAKLLISKKGNIETSRRKRTPLSLACENGHSNIVQYLIAMKANIESPSMSGSTPLFYACEFNRVDVVKYLLEMKANIETPNNVFHLKVFVF
eukprot:TRINITY_DN6277_c1_g1_i4.p1 TRINITY_DN6277_c1_g1~~TRINITY_DN6277_c1_g1_i4.p1  ORF type:complete len:165 (+),score=40.57 TRINITY_DN6277_c1_g1_i4:23-496(+)